MWAAPLIFGGFFPKISDFFRGQKANADMTHADTLKGLAAYTVGFGFERASF